MDWIDNTIQQFDIKINPDEYQHGVSKIGKCPCEERAVRRSDLQFEEFYLI
jgi:hypothetical protein